MVVVLQIELILAKNPVLVQSEPAQTQKKGWILGSHVLQDVHFWSTFTCAPRCPLFKYVFMCPASKSCHVYMPAVSTATYQKINTLPN